jgi:hypothetical protein
MATGGRREADGTTQGLRSLKGIGPRSKTGLAPVGVAAGLEDAPFCCAGETQSSDCEVRDLSEAAPRQ